MCSSLPWRQLDQGQELDARHFTPCSPLLNLPGRPHPQRPTYEELIEAGTLPRFIEIPTAPTKNPKSETATSTPDDTGQSTKRRRQTVANIIRRCSRRYSHRLVNGDSWSTDTETREDSIPQRQRSTEVNTVLALAGGDSRIETSTLTKDQKALHTAKVNELRNKDNFGVVKVVDRPQSQQVLSTRWVSKQRLNGSYKVRLVARGFLTNGKLRYSFFTLERQSSRLCAHFSRLQQFTEIQLLLEIVSAFRQSPMPVESEQCTWNQHVKHSWTLPRYGFARKL